jgi:hypothetical protein
MNLSDKLIIFDYSGTLSLEMAQFASSDNLLRHLKESGLFALGVNSAASFWDIINATWTKGSTTGRGYKIAMQERIGELSSGSTGARSAEISRAVAKFADAYLDHSRIDEHWRPLFETISRYKSAQVVIATDHYADATETIIGYFAQWGLKATTLAGNCPGNIIVANSADLGVHKERWQFWQIVRDALSQEYRRILLIDDFGQDEQQGDTYRDDHDVHRRQKKMAETLREVFAAEVESIVFTVRDKKSAKVISQTNAIIEKFLSVKSI